MKLLYLAGPFAAASRSGIEANVYRACRVSQYAVAAGFTPLTVHAAILARAYGDDGDPEDRERGLAAVCRLVQVVAERGGELWVLLTDGGDVSEGSAREWFEFVRFVPEGTDPNTRIRAHTYAEWCRILEIPA